MSSVLIYSKNTLFRECISKIVKEHPGVSTVLSIDDVNKVEDVMSLGSPDYVMIDLYSRNFDDNVLINLNKNFPGKIFILITTVENKHTSYYHYLYGIKHFIYAEESSDAIMDELAEIFSGKPANGRFKTISNVLTARECEILKLIASGLTSKEIADQLCISKNTVDTHRNKMLQKLNLANSASLVHYAYKSGLF